MSIEQELILYQETAKLTKGWGDKAFHDEQYKHHEKQYNYHFKKYNHFFDRYTLKKYYSVI